MANSTDALDIIRTAREHSESAWEGAVGGAEIDDDCADGPKHAAAEEAMDACLAAYDHAIEMLEVMSEGWRVAAEASLEEARSLESEYGECGDADDALEALRGCSDETDDDMVTIEAMPEERLGSHRAAGNFGTYPLNGADRTVVTREEAEEIIANDPDGYAHIV